MTLNNTNPTERATPWSPMALTAVLAFVLLFVAGAAHAGIPRVAQTHPFKVSGSIFSQEVSEKTGDDILGKDKFNEKDFAANCLMQENLRKDQSVVLLFNDTCEDINDNELQVISTEPPATMTVGQVHFDDDDPIVTEKNGTAITRTLRAEVELDCNGTASIDVLAGATATIKLGNIDGLCTGVESMKLKNASGYGVIDGVDVLLDGVKADAKKPSS